MKSDITMNNNPIFQLKSDKVRLDIVLFRILQNETERRLIKILKIKPEYDKVNFQLASIINNIFDKYLTNSLVSEITEQNFSDVINKYLKIINDNLENEITNGS